jgi:hypothetical protein
VGRSNILGIPLLLITPCTGEQLESVSIERQRAQAAHDLIDFYNQVSRGDTARLDTLKKEGREGRRQVAVILRRLMTVAKEVDLPSAEKVRLPPLYFRCCLTQTRREKA